MTRRPMVVSGGEAAKGGRSPVPGSGHSPKGGAAKASPAKPSVPNAVWRVEDRSANMFNIVEGKDYFDKTIIAFTANGVGMEYANLISAAPELYEALVELAEMLSNPTAAYALSMFGQRSPEELAALASKVQAAVAKARGESQ
jgi:hypothetical protein